VKSLIELHGGELDMVSQKGIGTTATLIFPKKRVAQEETMTQPVVEQVVEKTVSEAPVSEPVSHAVGQEEEKPAITQYQPNKPLYETAEIKLEEFEGQDVFAAPTKKDPDKS